MHNVQSVAPEREKNKYSVQNNTCKQRANGKGRLINFGRIPVMSFVPECIRSGAFFLIQLIQRESYSPLVLKRSSVYCTGNSSAYSQCQTDFNEIRKDKRKDTPAQNGQKADSAGVSGIQKKKPEGAE